LQFEEAEHRQGEQDEQAGEAGDQPGLHKPALQIRPEQCGHDAERRIDQRHAHRIAAGKRQTATRAGLAAHHDTGQDRQHGQRARRKGEQQAKPEEDQQAPAKGLLLQTARQRLVIGLYRS